MIENRPWGNYEVLLDEPNYKLKRIMVNQGHQLSYQSHEKRDEHWTIVSGTAEITIDGNRYLGLAGTHFHIPSGVKHRIKALLDGNAPVVFIEVQTGTYFGEDDIIRYEDDYHRVSKLNYDC